MMSLRPAALRAATTLQDRTLYIRVKPAPSNLSERRAVLRALKQYGHIEVFKKLYDDSSFIAVTRRIATWFIVKKESPFQFDYHDEHGVKVPDPRVAVSPPQPTNHAENGPTFTVEAFAAHDYPHKAIIRKSPLYGPWPLQTNKSLTCAALSQVVPKNMAAKGLADWETGAQVEDHDARIAWYKSQNNAARQRILRKEHRETLDKLAKMVNNRDDPTEK